MKNKKYVSESFSDFLNTLTLENRNDEFFIKGQTEIDNLNSTVLELFAGFGLYNTELDSEHIYDQEAQEYEGEGEYEFPDFEEHKKYITEQAQLVIDSEIIPFFKSKDLGIVSIIATGIYSPSTYNYGNDQLDMNMIVESDFIQKLNDYLNANTEGLEEYLTKYHTSKPGFSSFLYRDYIDYEKTHPKSTRTEQFLYELSKNEIKELYICVAISFIVDDENENWFQILAHKAYENKK